MYCYGQKFFFSLGSLRKLASYNYYSFNNLMGNTNHLNICAIYIPLETSLHFSEDIFDNLRDDINTFSNHDNPLRIINEK